MQPLPVIPRPLPERLRDARTKLLPALVFLCTVAVITLVWRAHFIPAQISAEAPVLIEHEQGMASAVPPENSGEDELIVLTGGTRGGPGQDAPFARAERASRN